MAEPITSTAIKGSCLCGAIQYELSSGLGTNIMCWCDNCRKATGSLFMANTFVKRDTVRMLTPRTTLKTYIDKAVDSGGAVRRSFCSTCGSCVFGENDKYPDMIIVGAGSLDCLGAGTTWTADTELFTQKNKADWLSVTLDEEGKKRFEEAGFLKK